MLYLCCAMTIALELLFFAFTSYRRRQYFMLLCAVVNIATNLTLNLILNGRRTLPVILLLELLVVIIEYVIYAIGYGRSGRLFLLTFGANLLSFLTGVVLFGL